MPIRVLVADDHRIVRQGLRTFLGLDPELEVVGEAANGAEAVRLAHEALPDVALLDVAMPILDGVAATGTIRDELPDVEVVVLVGASDDPSVAAAVEAGAIGFVAKDAPAEELRGAVKAAAAGQVRLTPQAAANLLLSLGTLPAGRHPLTARDADVLRRLAGGHADEEMAHDLGIGERSVRTLVNEVLGKLGVPGRALAVLYAVQMGLVPADRARS